MAVHSVWPNALPVLICLTTCPDLATATRIAETLVAERLVACASLLPGVRSVYRWEGRVERADEVQLLLKTTADGLQALEARLGALHPYALPELVALEAAGGSAAYLAWVEEQVSPGMAP